MTTLANTLIKIKALSIGTLLVCLSTSSQALDPVGKLSINGFGSLGLVYDGEDNADYIRTTSQPDVRGGAVTYTPDTRLGIQATYNYNPKLDFTLQAVSRFNHNRAYTPQITWAYARYNTSNWTIRAGRLGADNFFRADSLDVGYGLLWARPPVDYYGIHVSSQFDGIDVSKTLYTDWGSVELKSYGGKFNNAVYSDSFYKVDVSDSYVAGFITGVEVDKLLIRFSYSHFNVKTLSVEVPFLKDIYPPLASFQTSGFNSDYYTLGSSYDTGRWRLQGSISRLRQSGENTTPDNLSSYISVGYKYKRWTPYIVISKTKPHSYQRISLVPSIGSMAFTSPVNDQYTIALGSRIDIAPNVAIKLQAERVRSKSSNSVLWVNENNWDKDATVLSVVLDFVF